MAAIARRGHDHVGERGTGLVEMAAVTSVLVLACFGLIEMGMAGSQRTEVDVAIRHDWLTGVFPGDGLLLTSFTIMESG